MTDGATANGLTPDQKAAYDAAYSSAYATVTGGGSQDQALAAAASAAYTTGQIESGAY